MSDAPLERKAEFPHLSMLTFTRPVRRLRHEILFGNLRVSIAGVALVLLLSASLHLLGVPLLTCGIIALAFSAVSLALTRWLVLHGIITLSSLKILNKRPISDDLAWLFGHRIRMVSGTRRDLRRVKLRRPLGRDGPHVAVYERSLPLVWRRFSPGMSDARISRAACAGVQQM